MIVDVTFNNAATFTSETHVLRSAYLRTIKICVSFLIPICLGKGLGTYQLYCV